RALGGGAERGVQIAVRQVVGEEMGAVLIDQILGERGSRSKHEAPGGENAGIQGIAFELERADKVLRALDDVEGDGEIAAGMGDNRGDLDAAVAGGLIQAGDVIHAGSEQRLAEAPMAEDAFQRKRHLRQEIFAREELVAVELDLLYVVARTLRNRIRNR